MNKIGRIHVCKKIGEQNQKIGDQTIIFVGMYVDSANRKRKEEKWVFVLCS